MRLFKSRKSGEYSDVSSVVANENDPHVKIVSCNSQQDFHSNGTSIENGGIDKPTDTNESPSTNGFHSVDEQKKLCGSVNEINNYSIHHHNNIPYSLKPTENGCMDKFTPIPDCDKLDEPTPAHYESSTSVHKDSATETTMTTSTTTATATATATATTITTTSTNQEILQHSDSTSDFINELFGISTAILLINFQFSLSSFLPSLNTTNILFHIILTVNALNGIGSQKSTFFVFYFNFCFIYIAVTYCAISSHSHT